MDLRSLGEVGGETNPPAHQALPQPPSPPDGYADVCGDDGWQAIQSEEEGPSSALHMFNPAPAFAIAWPGVFPDANDKRNGLCPRFFRSSTSGVGGNNALLFHKMASKRGKSPPYQARFCLAPSIVFQSFYIHIVTASSQIHHRSITAEDCI